MPRFPGAQRALTAEVVVVLVGSSGAYCGPKPNEGGPAGEQTETEP